MVLYTCGSKKAGPGFAHPCAKAGKVLDDGEVVSGSIARWAREHPA
jgi:hypothetical protein